DPVRADATRVQRLDPRVDRARGEQSLELSLERSALQAGDRRQGLDALERRAMLRGRGEEEPAVARLVGAVQRRRAERVLTSRLLPGLAVVLLEEERLQRPRGVDQRRVDVLALAGALAMQQRQRNRVCSEEAS